MGCRAGIGLLMSGWQVGVLVSGVMIIWLWRIWLCPCYWIDPANPQWRLCAPFFGYSWTAKSFRW